MRIHEEVRKMPVSPIRTWTSRLHDLSPRAELTRKSLTAESLKRPRRRWIRD